MNTNGTSGGGRFRPRIRLTAADLIPKKITVMTITNDDGTERELQGYVWGRRVPGLVEARVLDNWNRDRDENGRIADPVRRREAIEEAVVGLVEGLTLTQAGVMSTIELIAILEDLNFLKPSDETSRLLAEMSDEDEQEDAEGDLPPDTASESVTTIPTSTLETSSPASELSTASV